jgi:hypothetical protein
MSAGQLFWLEGILGLVMGGMALALVGAFKARYEAGQNSTSASDIDGYLSGCRTEIEQRLDIFLGAFPLILWVGVSVAQNWYAEHYYDYFAINVLLYPLPVPWFSALMLSFLLIDPPSAKVRDRLLMRGIMLGLLLFLGIPLLLLFTPNWTARSINAMVEGPELRQGIVEDRDSFLIRGSRSRYVEIDGTSYRAPGAAWYNTLRRGQEVEFLASDSPQVAFAPDKGGFTEVGLMLVIAALFPWLVTIYGALLGLDYWRDWLRRRTTAVA